MTPALVRLIEAADGGAATGGEAVDSAAVSGALLEAVDSGRFRVRVIRAGLSGNRNFYSDASLREAVPLFAGARVIVKADAVHLAGQGRDPRSVLGRIVDPRFVDGEGPDAGAIEAVFEALDPADPMIVKLREAIARGMTDLFGLSIDAVATGTERGGVRRVGRFTRVNSVDLIVEPGAGGRVLDVVEAAALPTQETPMRNKIIKLLRARHKRLIEGKDLDAMSDGDLELLLTEAAGDSEDHRDEPEVLTLEAFNARLAEADARRDARDIVARSTLPETARTRVMEILEARRTFDAAAVNAAIAAEQAYLAPLSGGGRVSGLGSHLTRIETGETRAEKVQAMLEAFFDPAHKDHRHARSFKRCYVEITGDEDVTGMLRNCDQALMREALNSTSFDAVLGDSITRRMVADYRAGTVYDVWRRLVSTTTVNDFRTQERTRFGGYGDIPGVAEGADYAALTSPSDESAEYAVTKRGGLESVTLEMIKNDDVGAIQRIPTRLSRAAKRTLAKFVLDFIRTNPVIYDTVALFHASHGNLGAAALSSASVAAGRLAMLKMTEAGSADRLGIGPRDLWVPADLEEAAVDLFRRSTNNDKTFAQSLALNVIPVWYWTDANDWAMSADPADIPTIEIGFLDGKEEPELFVQDSPTVGSMFSADKLTWKIRHIYGGTVLDFRGLYKAVVA